MGGIAVEITTDFITFPRGKRDDAISLKYKIVTRITFLITTLVAPGSQVSDGRLDGDLPELTTPSSFVPVCTQP